MQKPSERIVEIRRALIIAFNQEEKQRMLDEDKSPEYIEYWMDKIESGNEMSSLFWDKAIMDYLDEILHEIG